MIFPPATKATRIITDPQLLIDEAERVADAMELLSEAMERSDATIAQAERAHFTKFERQMQELTGIKKVEMQEPYLAGMLAQSQLRLVEALARNLAPLEQFANTLLEDAEALISGEATSVSLTIKQAAPAPLPLELKALRFDRPLAPQLRASIDSLTERETIRLSQALDEKRQRQFGVSHYVWSTMGDDRVRPSHQANAGETFSWDNPPPTGHPGSAPGCRCSAVPVLMGSEGGDRLEDDPDRIDRVYPELYILPFLLTAPAVAGGAALVTGIRIGAQALREALKNKPPPAKPLPRGKLFRRPKGVPKDWVKRPADKGEGVKYVDPKNSGNDVRIQKGSPDAKWPSQQRDYVRWKRNGQWLDKNGRPVSRNSPEGHIPIEDFNFDLRVFK